MTGIDWSARGYELVVDERFGTSSLDRDLWLPHYLPQWSDRQRSAARWSTGDGLTLRIDADQLPWHPELDGPLRVSCLQTGVRSGPVGSTIGQHRFNEAAVVQEQQSEQRLWTPHNGVVEIRCGALDLPRTMVALWMIGFEDSPERSAEICVCEIFGSEVQDRSALVGMGLHPFGDPSIVDDFDKVRVGLDVREPHTYAVEWTPTTVTWTIDGVEVKQAEQSPAYPMQLMLTLYEFEPDPLVRYPVEWHVEHVRGWARPS